MPIAALFTQSVSVSTRQRGGSYGAGFADPVSVACFINDKRQDMLTSTGEQTISETTLYTALADLPKFTLGSRVTVNGRVAEVLATYQRDSAGPPSTHHAQIILT